MYKIVECGIILKICTCTLCNGSNFLDIQSGTFCTLTAKYCHPVIILALC